MLLGLTATVSATDPPIPKKIFGSGMTALTISNEEMADIMKIVKSLGKSGLLIIGVSETIKKGIIKYKGIIKKNLNLTLFIQEIIYLK